ncbi:MAG: hypothetical protein HOQ24_14215 [Mycobacteriaceae bacterium]|nr:hypothetical protein [Mycobacteriaceae bacterium]
MRTGASLLGLAKAVEKLAAHPACALDRTELAYQLPVLLAQIHRLQSTALKWLDEADAMGAYAVTGYPDSPTWLGHRSTCDYGLSTHLTWLAERLPHHPEVSEAVDACRFGIDHAGLLIRFLDDHAEDLADHPRRTALLAELLADAEHPDTAVLSESLLHCAQSLTPPAAAPAALTVAA